MFKRASITAIVLLFLIPMITDARGTSEMIRVHHSDIGVIVDGRGVVFEERPFIHRGRVYVPARSISTALGMDIHWNDEMKTVVLKSSDYKFPLTECRPEKGELFVYGEIIDIDYANYTIDIHQHLDDNSIPITNPLRVDEDVIIALQRENNLHFYELNTGSNGGFILNNTGTVRGIIIAKTP